MQPFAVPAFVHISRLLLTTILGPTNLIIIYSTGNGLALKYYFLYTRLISSWACKTKIIFSLLHKTVTLLNEFKCLFNQLWRSGLFWLNWLNLYVNKLCKRFRAFSHYLYFPSLFGHSKGPFVSAFLSFFPFLDFFCHFWSRVLQQQHIVVFRTLGLIKNNKCQKIYFQCWKVKMSYSWN